MEYSDFINISKDELLDVCDNLFLIKKENDFQIIKYNENNKKDALMLYSSINRESILNEFNLMINAKPTKLIIKEDPIGYPNNNSVVAFSPHEQPSRNNMIVYYEYNHNTSLLERHEALKDFANSTNYKINDKYKETVLKSALYKTFNYSQLEFANRITFPEWRNKKRYSNGDQVDFIVSDFNTVRDEVVDFKYNNGEDEWEYITKNNFILLESDVVNFVSKNKIKKDEVLYKLSNETKDIDDYLKSFDNDLNLKDN